MKVDVLGIRPPERAAFPSHVQWAGDRPFLSPPEVDAVRAHCAQLPLFAGTIGNGSVGEAKENSSYRCVETCAVHGLEWLYKRVLEYAGLANADYYRFNLIGLTEPIGYLKYTSASETKPAGHYNWHQDFGGGPFASRKLSMIIQLSDPATYVGGRLWLCNDGPWESPYVNAGDAILFPSWTPHMVSELTEGVREALVIWVAGPQFA